MRFRLPADLPLTVQCGGTEYVLDLVDDVGTGCWLRARAADEPVVFLLSRFPHRHAARHALATGFEVVDRIFPLILLHRLVTAGVAERVDRRATRRVIGAPAERELAPAPVLQMA